MTRLRITLVLSPDQDRVLAELARANYRDPKREALRLLPTASALEELEGLRKNGLITD